ncbi:MAG: metallophosphoesterase [Cytophagaceae bacterium]|jgi:predicted MPP superfamily phosphohydrolase|nr:metallophosphoesterase [Cytophagaceae bacterium]
MNVISKGLGRIKYYEFEHPDLPSAFDGFTVAFLSDFHYKSIFNEKRLSKAVKTINRIHPDLLLLGGDYVESCEYASELLLKISEIETSEGIIAVLGNNDYENCYCEILTEINKHGIQLMEHQTDSICKNNECIYITGVRNPFDLKNNRVSPTLSLNSTHFVILLVHTPDYAENVSIHNSDLVLAGHTHGGQITLFGLYAPVLPSRYRQRFRSGKRYNSAGIPVFITNGLGTSQKNIRLFAPSEVMVITFRVRL